MSDNTFTELSLDDLARVSGGKHAAAHQSWNPFGWLDSIFHSVVNHFAGNIGGQKLAEKMYGKHVTAKDTARSQAAMKKFLADGHKLPKGVPNLFGRD